MKTAMIRFGLWLGLLAVLSVTTGALQIAHLHGCQSTESTHTHKHNPVDSHDHQHCRVCRMLAGIGGKYVCIAPALYLLFDAAPTFGIVYPSQTYPAQTRSCGVARAPPVA